MAQSCSVAEYSITRCLPVPSSAQMAALHQRLRVCLVGVPGELFFFLVSFFSRMFASHTVLTNLWDRQRRADKNLCFHLLCDRNICYYFGCFRQDVGLFFIFSVSEIAQSCFNLKSTCGASRWLSRAAELIQ